MRYVCVHPGCENGVDTGHALQRVSPKGEDFAGACEEHSTAPVDEVALWIQDRNHGRSEPPRPP